MACLGSAGFFSVLIELREARRDLMPGEEPIRISWATGSDMEDCACFLSRQSGGWQVSADDLKGICGDRKKAIPTLLARDFEGELLGLAMVTTAISKITGCPHLRIEGPFVTLGHKSRGVERRLRKSLSATLNQKFRHSPIEAETKLSENGRYNKEETND